MRLVPHYSRVSFPSRFTRATATCKVSASVGPGGAWNPAHRDTSLPLFQFLLQTDDRHIRGNERRRGVFQEWTSESATRSRLPTYFKLFEMREGLLQCPMEFQLAFQVQQVLLVLLTSRNDTTQNLLNRDPELSDECRDPTF
jgi:hypothetical protein